MTLERTIQPMTDAVERPMTLIEKLEQARSEYINLFMLYEAKIIKDCIEIVKQHSDWISVDERLPEREYCEYLVWVGYPDIATYSKFGWELPSDAVITHWQPMPKIPSEVQDDM